MLCQSQLQTERTGCGLERLNSFGRRLQKLTLYSFTNNQAAAFNKSRDWICWNCSTRVINSNSTRMLLRYLVFDDQQKYFRAPPSKVTQSDRWDLFKGGTQSGSPGICLQS